MNWRIKDSRGSPSTTLTFVVISLGVVLVKFLFAGMTIPHLGQVPPMDGINFAAAAGAILAIWYGREKTEKDNAKS